MDEKTLSIHLSISFDAAGPMKTPWIRKPVVFQRMAVQMKKIREIDVAGLREKLLSLIWAKSLQKARFFCLYSWSSEIGNL
jgi:hypothetical protein